MAIWPRSECRRSYCGRGRPIARKLKPQLKHVPSSTTPPRAFLRYCCPAARFRQSPGRVHNLRSFNPLMVWLTLVAQWLNSRPEPVSKELIKENGVVSLARRIRPEVLSHLRTVCALVFATFLLCTSFAGIGNGCWRTDESRSRPMLPLSSISVALSGGSILQAHSSHCGTHTTVDLFLSSSMYPYCTQHTYAQYLLDFTVSHSRATMIIWHFETVCT